MDLKKTTFFSENNTIEKLLEIIRTLEKEKNGKLSYQCGKQCAHQYFGKVNENKDMDQGTLSHVKNLSLLKADTDLIDAEVVNALSRYIISNTRKEIIRNFEKGFSEVRACYNLKAVSYHQIMEAYRR